MKKNIMIILLSTVLIFLLFYFGFSRSVKYEVLAIEDAPISIQAAIKENKDKLRFSIFQDETNTYIYYKSNHVANEYITTNLDIKLRGGKYIATANVSFAVNDGNVNYDQLIKLNTVLDRDITLIETNNTVRN